MEKPLPVNYRSIGLKTAELPEFIEKHPKKYVDMTVENKSLMLFGMISQIFNTLFGIYQSIKFEPSFDQ